MGCHPPSHTGLHTHACARAHASLSFSVCVSRHTRIIRVIESWLLPAPAECTRKPPGLRSAIDWVAGNDAVKHRWVKVYGWPHCHVKLKTTLSHTSQNKVCRCAHLQNSASRCNYQANNSHFNWSSARLTSLLGGLVVGFTDKPAVLHQVVLVTCGQLPLAHDASKTVQVIHEVLRSPHHLCGRDPLLTSRAFCPESPFWKIDSCY